MAAGLTARLGSKSQRTRGWRSVLAALISLALVLSLFHCCCLDGDEGALTVAVAQTSCDVAGKVDYAAPSPHCCHCLAHVTTVAPQDEAVAIEYVARIPRLTAALLPDAADLASPFEPPRA
jgi:hypothetical protein